MYHRESTSYSRSNTKYGYPLPKALQMQKPAPQYSHPLVPPSTVSSPPGGIAPPSTSPMGPPRGNPVTPYCSSTNGRLPCFMKNFR